jgi:glycosyltransferase involved in cell wall biosynthesis
MDIGIISSFIDEMSGGIGVYTYNLIKNLNIIDKKNDYHLIHYMEKNDRIYRDNNDIIIPKLNFMNKMVGSYSIWRYYILPSKMKQLKIDMVHDPYELGPLSFNMPFKKVVTIHDLSPIIFPKLFKWGDVMIHKLLFKKTVNSLDKIITISEHSKKDIMDYLHVPEEKIDVVYLGKDPIFEPMGVQEVQDIYKRYGITSKFILTVGGIHPIKNISNLLKSFYKLKKSGLEHKLVVVGNKMDKWETVFEKVQDLNLKDQVIFTGVVPLQDLAKLYNAAELFVYPCLYAGFGLPPLESMACGTPVVTSNNSSIPEVVGKAGVLIDPYNVQELAEAMENVLMDIELQEELKKKGLKRSELFNWKDTAAETLKIYENVV